VKLNLFKEMNIKQSVFLLITNVAISMFGASSGLKSGALILARVSHEMHNPEDIDVCEFETNFN
jgi:hypothetical protein